MVWNNICLNNLSLTEIIINDHHMFESTALLEYYLHVQSDLLSDAYFAGS